MSTEPRKQPSQRTLVNAALWAATGVKDPSLPDTLYVTELAAPNTVNTMPGKTLDATFEHAFELAVPPRLLAAAWSSAEAARRAKERAADADAAV